jgi:hypothetical protein
LSCKKFLYFHKHLSFLCFDQIHVGTINHRLPQIKPERERVFNKFAPTDALIVRDSRLRIYPGTAFNHDILPDSYRLDCSSFNLSLLISFPLPLSFHHVSYSPCNYTTLRISKIKKLLHINREIVICVSTPKSASFSSESGFSSRGAAEASKQARTKSAFWRRGAHYIF